MGTTTHKLLLIFLLLCFQTQTLAAMVLSCARGDSSSDLVAESCHQPAAATGEKSDSAPPEKSCYDCHKCQLGCAFGVSAIPFARDPGIASVGKPMVGRISVRHFYRFVPAPLQRPPIFALS